MKEIMSKKSKLFRVNDSLQQVGNFMPVSIVAGARQQSIKALLSGGQEGAKPLHRGAGRVAESVTSSKSGLRCRCNRLVPNSTMHLVVGNEDLGVGGRKEMVSKILLCRIGFI